MSGEVEKCPILHVHPKFDVFTVMKLRMAKTVFFCVSRASEVFQDFRTHGAKNGGSFSEMVGPSISN